MHFEKFSRLSLFDRMHVPKNDFSHSHVEQRDVCRGTGRKEEKKKNRKRKEEERGKRRKEERGGKKRKEEEERNKRRMEEERGGKKEERGILAASRVLYCLQIQLPEKVKETRPQKYF